MKTIKILLISVLILNFISCDNGMIAKKNLETEIDSVSYALGMDMGIKVRTNFSNIDDDLFIQGFVSGLDSTEILIAQKNLSGLLSGYFQKKQQKLFPFQDYIYQPIQELHHKAHQVKKQESRHLFYNLI